jgi:hypothetical protein
MDWLQVPQRLEQRAWRLSPRNLCGSAFSGWGLSYLNLLRFGRCQRCTPRLTTVRLLAANTPCAWYGAVSTQFSGSVMRTKGIGRTVACVSKTLINAHNGTVWNLGALASRIHVRTAALT